MWTMKTDQCTNAQADLSLRWTQMSEGTGSHVAAKIYSICCLYETITNARTK